VERFLVPNLPIETS